MAIPFFPHFADTHDELGNRGPRHFPSHPRRMVWGRRRNKHACNRKNRLTVSNDFSWTWFGLWMMCMKRKYLLCSPMPTSMPSRCSWPLRLRYCSVFLTSFPWPACRAVLNGKKKVFQNQFSQKSPRALHVLNHGWWRLVAVGGWRLAAVGGWRSLGAVLKGGP